MSEPLPQVDFATLVLSLSQSALVYLGQAEDAEGAPPSVDLSLARHSVELLVLLEEKTKGNLSGQEERLLGSVLVDLRARLADLTGGKSA